MVDLVRRTIPGSCGGAERRRKLRETEERLRGELGRDATAAEVAAALGLDEGELDAMRRAAEPVRVESLDEAYSDSDLAYADDRPDSFAILADAELREHLVEAISALPERLQLVVQLYFVEELNLSEIAEALQVSVPRVHQLKAQAIDRLRAGLAGVAEII
jgi:RNA polymerase sigma factor FliA